MENTSTLLIRHRIHKSNFDLHRSVAGPGLVGSRHSELINRLVSKAHDFKHPKEPKNDRTESISDQIKTFKQKVQDLQREQLNLKKEMLRMSELTKTNKNSRIAMQIKYESLLNEYKKKEVDVLQLQQKLQATTELNNYLLKITENTLSILPHYENNCDSLKTYIGSIKTKLSSKDEQSRVCTIIDDFSQKLDIFKNEVDTMQHYQKKMMTNITEAHLSTKNINQRLSIMSNINMDEFMNFRNEISNIHDVFQPYCLNEDSSEEIEQREQKLDLVSDVCPFTFFPESGPRINKIFSDVTLLFQQHIHLLESQKMEYQFTKNKKMIACQKFQCQICESYEKIVSQTFSIVRQAFKQIKFNFLREIKQIGDVSEIPILI